MHAERDSAEPFCEFDPLQHIWACAIVLNGSMLYRVLHRVGYSKISCM